jgi:eukaryotic-like serine/threonine-protein kinase
VSPTLADHPRIGQKSPLATLNHPGLVTVLDAGTVEDRPFLVMELVDGAALSSWVRGAALDPRYVAAAGAQVADALRYVHGEGTVHRDVTPANILLARDGRYCWPISASLALPPTPHA